MSYQTTVLADAPYAYWRLNETTGTVAADLGSGNNPATYVGAGTRGIASMLAGDTTSKGYSPAGAVANYVMAPAPLNAYPVTTSWTIEFWHKVDAADMNAFNKDAIMGNRCSTLTTGFITASYGGNNDPAYVAGQNTVASKNDGGNNVAYATPTLPNVVHHYVFTYSQAVGMRAYQDGVFQHAQTSTYPAAWATGATAPAWFIGTLGSSTVANSGDGGSSFTGVISEVALYPTVLSDARILAHYNAGTTASVAAVAFVQSASNGTALATTTVTLATAPIAGNLLVAMVSGTGVRTYTTPTGWAILAPLATLSTCSEIAYWKAAAGTEGTALSFTGSVAAVNGAMVYELSGASTSAPVASSSNAAASSAVTFTSSTPAVANSMAIEFAAPAIAGTTVTVPTGYTGQTQNTSNHCPRGAFRASLPISDASAPCTLGTAVDWASLIVIVAPASTSTTYTSTLTAGLTFAGAVSKRLATARTAALSFAVSIPTTSVQSGLLLALQWRVSGATTNGFTRAISRAIAAALGLSGAFTTVKNVASKLIAFTAGLTFAGAQTRAVSRAFTAIVSTIGTQSKAISKAVAASLPFVGAIAKATSRAFAATLAFSGALTSAKNVIVAKLIAFTASVGFAGVQTRSTLRSFFASVATAGAQTKMLSRSMSARVTFAGVEGRLIPTVLAAVLSFAGNLATFFAKGGLTAIGNREYTAGATGTGKNAPGSAGTGDNPGGSVGNEQ